MPIDFKIITFAAMTIGLVWLSWPSFRDIRSHGFYRFFLWEFLLILVLINLDDWFDKPFCFRQLISWLLFVISILALVFGVATLRKKGKPDSVRDDPQLRGIEKTTELVTDGLYRYIRHPIYSSALFGAWGIFLKRPSVIGLGLTILTCIFMIITAKMEEIENLRFFGEQYREYMSRTKMFVPYIF